MTKISVSVNVPAIGHSHEFLIPKTMAVRNVIQLMVSILASEYGVSNSISDITLIDESDGKALKAEFSFSQLGVSDGTKLILI